MVLYLFCADVPLRNYSLTHDWGRPKRFHLEPPTKYGYTLWIPDQNLENRAHNLQVS